MTETYLTLPAAADRLDMDLRYLRRRLAMADRRGLFISAPDEDPNWDARGVPVDWTGFEDALRIARNGVTPA